MLSQAELVLVRRISKPWGSQTDQHSRLSDAENEHCCDRILVLKYLAPKLFVFKVVVVFSAEVYCSYLLISYKCVCNCVVILFWCWLLCLLLQLSTKWSRKTHPGPLPSPLYLPVNMPPAFVYVYIGIHACYGLVVLKHNKHCQCLGINFHRC